jgi:hypothetical protein
VPVPFSGTVFGQARTAKLLAADDGSRFPITGNNLKVTENTQQFARRQGK